MPTSPFTWSSRTNRAEIGGLSCLRLRLRLQVGAFLRSWRRARLDTGLEARLEAAMAAVALSRLARSGRQAQNAMRQVEFDKRLWLRDLPNTTHWRAGFEFLSDGKENRLLLWSPTARGKFLSRVRAKWTAHVLDELTLLGCCTHGTYYRYMALQAGRFGRGTGRHSSEVVEP